MSVEETKSIDNSQEIIKNISTNIINYTNPSKKITEKNDLLVKEDQEDADDLLPENIKKRWLDVKYTIDKVEDIDTKNEYLSDLRKAGSAIKSENWTEANTILTDIEKRLSTKDVTTVESEKEETKKPENTEEKQGQDVTRNAESKGNNRNGLEGLLNDEERMEENKGITVVQKNP